MSDSLPKAPFEQVPVTLSKQEVIDLKWQANHYKALWKRSKQREADALRQVEALKSEYKTTVSRMQAEIDSLKNQLAEMKHLLFGRSNEKALSATTKSNAPPPSTRQRGQQKKTKGHGRRQHEHLPIVFEALLQVG